MSTFYDYLKRNQPEYEFRIKCLDDITAMQGDLEKFLSRYKLKDITKVKKMIFRKRSLDFPEHENVEVFFIDIVTELPITPPVLAKQLSDEFYIDGKRLVVRRPGEPTEQYIDKQQTDAEVEDAIDSGKLERDSLLSTESSYPEAPKPVSLYGDEYNETYLETINKLRAKQKEEHIKVVENPLSYKETRDFKAPKDFNSKIKDGPTVKKLKAKLNMVPYAVKDSDFKGAKLNSKYKKSENPKK